MTTFHKIIITTAITAGLGAGIYGAYQVSVLRRENQLLQTQQASLAARVLESQHERDDMTNRLALLTGELGQMKGRDAELLKLRAEVTRLRANAGSAFAEPSLLAQARDMALLKQKLQQMPDKRIPELQFVTEKDWANAVRDADLTTEDGVREALSKLRETAINTFLNEMMKRAFKNYLAAHDGILPSELSELKPYFDAPVSDAMLQRYKLLQTGKVDNSADLVRLVAPYADEDYDSNHGMSINGAWGGRFNRVEQAVGGAVADFVKDNNGQIPTDPAQLASYFKTPIDAATVQKYLAAAAQNPPPPEVAILQPALRAYGNANNGQLPQNPLQLVPYLTTEDQQTAFLKLEQMPPEAVTLVPALQAYFAGHNGQPPRSASDLSPYLTTSEQQAALQKIQQMKYPALR